MSEYFGKYRGKVESNADPMQLGRVQVSVPDVLGDIGLSWATPCVPYAGPGVGFFAIPPVGANVWVEFEGGDPDYPIWSGCFWGMGELPVLPALAEIKIFKTEGISLILDDQPGIGGFTIEVGPPIVPALLRLVFDVSGIELSNEPASFKITSKSMELATAPATVKLAPGSIELSNGGANVSLSPATVSINHGALEVT